jgi:mono/diheme cytochrome c family protein
MKSTRFAMILTVLLAGAAFRSSAMQSRSGTAVVTFAGDVAPILYANCVSCHRAGEVAPFALVTYEDVARKAKQIAKVTQSRVMPPWHAAHGYGDFADERGLTDAQIATIREWVAAGMPRGNRAKMPALPTFTEGWQLGAPDLVLEMPAAFDVPAGGPDVYRNFVLPTGLVEDKWVRAVEFRPGTRTVVHHALLHYIRGGAAAKLVSPDGKPGYGGAMPAAFIPSFAPAGELGVWAVGMTPRALPEGLALPLPKGSDVVLQLHLHPSGKPEIERAKIGIYFASSAPSRRIRELGVLGFFGLLAGIDIPPGEKNFSIKGSLTLPADMHVISVMAHAHYLGKEFTATATLPDGSTRPMLWIKDWDFNWQDRYFYKQPVALPKGTRIDVTISYDNSADNPHNPCDPPRRVQWGLQSTDEMGGVRFQMVTADDAAEAQMEAAAAGIRAAVAKVARSEAAQDAIKKAAARNAEMEERFRAGLLSQSCGG